MASGPTRLPYSTAESKCEVSQKEGTAIIRYSLSDGLLLCLAASGSGSVIGRDPLPPRAVSAMSLQQQIKDAPPPAITLTVEDKPQDHSAPNSVARKTSPSSGGKGHPSVLDSPSSAGNVERSDAVDGQVKRVSCNTQLYVPLAIFCRYLTSWK
jgi:hypothetical protein